MKNRLATATGRRIDYDIIMRLVPSGSRVLDLGCGSGELLLRLEKEKHIRGQGVELSQARAKTAVSRGLSVIQLNIDDGLSGYADRSFDVVILDLVLESTLKPLNVIRESLRVGRHTIVNFPNFGYWRVRSQLFFKGKMPKTPELPFEWYDTPHVHLFTIADFWDLCRREKILVNNYYYHSLHKVYCGPWPNIFAEYGLFNLEK